MSVDQGRIRSLVSSTLLALASALVILAIAAVPFLSPQWSAFEQGRAGSLARTGFSADELRMVTDSILHDLAFGGSFDAAVGGAPVLDARERSHMVDVRNVFRVFAALSLICGLTFALSAWRNRERAWQALRLGALGLLAATLMLGALVALSFGLAFELFHRLLFGPGSYSFDPASERLVQLFPTSFWQDTTLALGGLVIILCVAVLGLDPVRRMRADKP